MKRKTQSTYMILTGLVVGLVAAGLGCDDGDSRDTPVGPDLQGEWGGRYFVERSSDSREETITATVSHRGNAIVIKTSKTGAGATFTGTIDADGDMTLTDANDGETWTTYFGPARSNAFRIADFLFDSDLGGSSPLQVIDLRR